MEIEMTILDMCSLPDNQLQELYLNITREEQRQNFTFQDFLEHRSDACSQQNFDLVVSRLVPVLFAAMVVLGIVGNAIVLVVVLFGKQMRNTTNILILNLALSDLLFVTICIPPTAVDYAIGWPFGDTWCKLVQYLVHVTTYSAVYTLVLLSLDRYLAVVYPVRSISLRTVGHTTVAILVTWVVVVTACVPIFFLFINKDIEFPNGDTRSICTFDRDNYSGEVFQASFFTTSLALPLLAILWLYMNMLVRLWRGSAALASGPGPARDKRNSCKGQENKRRVTRMIVIVIIAFALCWSPLQVVLLLRNLNLYDISNGALVALQIVTHCLAYFNSCINPILYAFFSPNFRSTFLDVVCRRQKSTTVQINSAVSHNQRRDQSAVLRSNKMAKEDTNLMVVQETNIDTRTQPKPVSLNGSLQQAPQPESEYLTTKPPRAVVEATSPTSFCQQCEMNSSSSSAMMNPADDGSIRTNGDEDDDKEEPMSNGHNSSSVKDIVSVTIESQDNYTAPHPL